jgi:predicted  nucleic acid-binding Zn-ribbon protein
VNAAPDVQHRLLDLQALDSAIDRLAQRRRTLPELAEIARLEARLGQLRDEIVGIETRISDIAREERRIEADIDVVRTRIAKDRQRLDTGSVNSPRELENLQHELVSLDRRRSDLEDLELEQMEVREGAETTLKALQTETDELAAQLAAAQARRDAQFADIDRDVAKATADRSLVAPALPADLVALYEKIRAASDGVGAALLRGTRCEGCHLSLSPVDVSRITSAPGDEIVRCEECRRILVRKPPTAEGEL